MDYFSSCRANTFGTPAETGPKHILSSRLQCRAAIKTPGKPSQPVHCEQESEWLAPVVVDDLTLSLNHADQLPLPLHTTSSV